MAILKCKMCGGDLVLSSDSTIAECEFCGTQQTVPTADNEKKITLFQRANRLRFACEFDKAAGIYESIVAEFPEEAEAYWGLVLCKYGIEYVDDPATAKKIPTCHRSSFDSVMDDSNFDLVMEYADAIARAVYRDEAKQIEELRKSIIEVSSKEEPYDIFICYKETALDGDRTIDSVIAQDVYDALTEKGYRVFFSRITLEDKLGQEYEPYIFAALNSAKIMLAFGTDYEYYNAVWVKNEWSRFLQLIAKGEKKTLIPCYKNIDAYDMPKEFAKLQAQDMGKVGAVQDLLRGIAKILPKNNSVQTAKETVVVQQSASNATVDSLLKRVFIFLEDEDFISANDYCEKVLDIDPENAQAYFGKVLVEYRLSSQEQLCETIIDVTKSKNFQRAYRYADAKYKKVLEEIDTKLQKKLLLFKLNFVLKKQQRLMEDRERKYQLIVDKMNVADSSEQFFAIAGELEKLNRYKDADVMKKTALQKAEEISAQEADGKERKLKELTLIRELVDSGLCMISAGSEHTVGLKACGTVVAVGNNRYGQCNVGDWADIVAIDAADEQTIGLKSDGTVIAVGGNQYGRCNVADWRDIVSIGAGGEHNVGLKADGTVVATGNNVYGQCNVSEWRDIVAISVGYSHTVGLRSDGTVVAVGEDGCNVSAWKDIIAIKAGCRRTVGIKKDGTVVATGGSHSGENNVNEFRNIVAISLGLEHTVGLSSGSIVKAVGRNIDGACNVQSWENIIAIATGGLHTVGLKSDGTVVAVGDNKDGRCNVRTWSDVVAISDGSVTVGLKGDGTVVATGDNRYGQCNVSDWRLFEDINDLLARCKDIEEAREKLIDKCRLKKAELDALDKEKQRLKEERELRRQIGLCQHCGGTFKGLFTKKCVNCGKPKDY